MKSLIKLPPTSRSVQRRRVVITLLFFLLASAYSSVQPIFEVSDELHHYPVVDYIADHGELPAQNVNRPNAWDWEAAQPPLYYVLSALIVAPFDRDDLAQFQQPNPHAKAGIGAASDNQNMLLHDSEAEAFPWQGTPLHVHLVRFFSVLLGTWAVWMSFAVARLAVPQWEGSALLAMALTAFNPMFLSISASVNNDNLVNALVPTGFAIALTIWQDGFRWNRVWALALIGTLAAASKLSGLILFLPAGLTIFLTIWRDRLPWRNVIFAALIFLVVWGGLVGWWYLRNLNLYDDFFGNTHMAKTVGLRDEPISVSDLVREEWGSFFAAYWGWLGGLTILLPEGLFWLARLIWVLGAIGLLIFIIERLFRRRVHSDSKNAVPANERPVGRAFMPSALVPLLLLLFTFAIALVSFIRWTQITLASQGRLLFPFIAAISTLTAVGLFRIFRGRLAFLVSAPLLFYALWSVMVAIPHAYRLPNHLDQIPDTAQPVDATWDGIQLVGYEIEDTVIRPGGYLEVTLYWRALEQTEKPLSFFINIYGSDEDLQPIPAGKLDSYPGRGMLRTDRWETGVIFEDRYLIEVTTSEEPLYPYEPRLHIGWRDNETNEYLEGVASDGTSLDAVIVKGGRVSEWEIPLDPRQYALFSNVIAVQEYILQADENQITLSVAWETYADLHEDFTVFVHLVEPGTQTPIIASGDRPPRDGWWNTSDWIPGRAFWDYYVISLENVPPGDYEILIGFYRPTDFTRLPVTNSVYGDAFVIPVTIE